MKKLVKKLVVSVIVALMALGVVFAFGACVSIERNYNNGGLPPNDGINTTRPRPQGAFEAPSGFELRWGDTIIWNNSGQGRFRVCFMINGMFESWSMLTSAEIHISLVPSNATRIRIIEVRYNSTTSREILSVPAHINITRQETEALSAPSGFDVRWGDTLVWNNNNWSDYSLYFGRQGQSGFEFLYNTRGAHISFERIPTDAVRLRVIERQNTVTSLTENTLAINGVVSVPGYIEIERNAQSIAEPSDFWVSGNTLRWSGSAWGYRFYLQRLGQAGYGYIGFDTWREISLSRLPYNAVRIKVVGIRNIGGSIDSGVLTITGEETAPGGIDIERRNERPETPSNPVISGSWFRWNSGRSGMYRIYVRNKGALEHEFLRTVSWGELQLSQIPITADSLRIIETRHMFFIENDVLVFSGGISLPLYIPIERIIIANLPTPSNFEIQFGGAILVWNSFRWSNYRIYVLREGQSEFEFLRPTNQPEFWIGQLPYDAVQIRVTEAGNNSFTIENGVLRISSEMSPPGYFWF